MIYTKGLYGDFEGEKYYLFSSLGETESLKSFCPKIRQGMGMGGGGRGGEDNFAENSWFLYRL